MIGRQIHKLKVRNKATGKEEIRHIDMNGTIDDAKAHIEKEPFSRGAPAGYEVTGTVDEATPVVETK